MESVELGLDDMFEERDIDEDRAIDQGMMDNEARDGDDERDENGDLQSQAVTRARDMSAGAAKKVVRNPQPKLDAARLNSERGFLALRRIFEDVQFKGKGNEISDFLVMMRTMEHWAHRLFPKMTFDEVIERCERLGGKAQVKTVVRKIRMGMPVRDDEFTERVGSEEEEEDAPNEEENNNEEFPNPEDEFDDMMRDAGADRMDDDSDSGPRIAAQPAPSSPLRAQTSPQAKSPVFGKTISDEQRERMERNRRLAMEKRQARLLAQSQASSQKPENASQAETTDIETAQREDPATAGKPEQKETKIDDDITDDDLLKQLDDDFDTEMVSATEPETGENVSPPESREKESELSHLSLKQVDTVEPLENGSDSEVTAIADEMGPNPIPKSPANNAEQSDMSPKPVDTIHTNCGDDDSVQKEETEASLNLRLEEDSSPLKQSEGTENLEMDET